MRKPPMKPDDQKEGESVRVVLMMPRQEERAISAWGAKHMLTRSAAIRFLITKGLEIEKQRAIAAS